MTGMRLRFEGAIAGLGTGAGTRMVLGHWRRSPFGPFSDVMLEHAGGQRTLLAPTHQAAAFIAETYTFDDVRIAPVTVTTTHAGTEWTVQAAELRAHFTLGPRGMLGRMLRAVPPALAAHPAWVTCADVPARALPGVRMRGSAGQGRREWYGVHDLQPIATASVHLGRRDLGPLRPIHPPVRFGFASLPRRPALARVTTTVELAP